MPETVAPAPASAPAPSAPAASPAPAPAASSPAPAAPAPTVENAPTISEAWERAVASVPVGEEDAPAADAPAPDAPAPDAPAPDAPAPDAEPDAPAVDPNAPAPDAPPAEPVPELILEDTDFGPKELGDFLKKDVGVEKFFNEHPDVKNRVFAMARRDQETRAIREIAPTLELAQEMQRGHALFSDIDGRFLNATTPEGFKSFMDMWVEQALMVDDKGQPIKGADGRYEVHPALTSVIENIHSNRNDYLASEMAKGGKVPAALADSTLKVIDFLSKSPDEGVQEAARIIKEALSPSSSAPDELPEQLKPYSERLDARAKALKEQEDAQARTQRESEQTARVQALTRADQKAAQVCVLQVKPLLKNAGLTEYEQKNAVREIGELIDAKLKDISSYQIARDKLESGPIDAAREAEISKVTLTYTQEILGPIVKDVIHRATEGKLARQTATDSRVAEQQRESRTDPRGTSISSSPGAPLSMAQIEDAVVKEYKDTHNGEMPDRRWITSEVWKRQTAAPARRTA